MSTVTATAQASTNSSQAVYIDLLKFAAPFVVAFATFLASIWYTSQSTTANMVAMTKKIDDFQSAKESRGERLATLEWRVGNLETGQKDISIAITALDKKLDDKTTAILTRLPPAK